MYLNTCIPVAVGSGKLPDEVRALVILPQPSRTPGHCKPFVDQLSRVLTGDCLRRPLYYSGDDVQKYRMICRSP